MKCFNNPSFEPHTKLNKLHSRGSITISLWKTKRSVSVLNCVKQLAYTLQSVETNVYEKEIAMALLNGLFPCSNIFS